MQMHLWLWLHESRTPFSYHAQICSPTSCTIVCLECHLSSPSVRVCLHLDLSKRPMLKDLTSMQILT